MIVIADTAPLNYLVLIGEVDVLPALYGRVIIPNAVSRELQATGTPQAVKDWLKTSPAWLEVKSVSRPADLSLGTLDAGEREAIQLAEELRPATVIIDDKDGRKAAETRSLRVIGTLGVLDDAASKNLLDLPQSLVRLQQTNFRLTPALIQTLLERDAERKLSERVQTVPELPAEEPEQKPERNHERGKGIDFER